MASGGTKGRGVTPPTPNKGAPPQFPPAGRPPSAPRRRSSPTRSRNVTVSRGRGGKKGGAGGTEARCPPKLRPFRHEEGGASLTLNQSPGSSARRGGASLAIQLDSWASRGVAGSRQPPALFGAAGDDGRTNRAPNDRQTDRRPPTASRQVRLPLFFCPNFAIFGPIFHSPPSPHNSVFSPPPPPQLSRANRSLSPTAASPHGRAVGGS